MYHSRHSVKTAGRKDQKTDSTKKDTPPPSRKDLMVIDNKPIFKKAITNAKKAMKDLKKKSDELETFEKIDQVEYSKWYNTSFGKNLTELRECEEKIHPLAEIFLEVEKLVAKKRIPHFLAYKEVMYRREHPEEFKDETEDTKRSSGNPFHDEEEDFDNSEEEFYRKQARFNQKFESGSLTEEDLKDLFDEFMKPGLEDMGLHPKMIDEFYQQFKQEYESKRGKVHTEHDTPKNKNELDLRLKERYRKLARRLHPDYNTTQTPEDLALWYKVQEAYSQRDLEKLDSLLALCDILKGGDFSKLSSVSQIIKIIQQYKEDIKALSKRIRLAKKNISWGFTKKKPTEIKSIQRDIQKELTKNIKERTEEFFYLQRCLDNWKKDADNYKKRPEPVKKQNPVRKKKTIEEELDDLDETLFKIFGRR
jgi:hypothetical protein